MLALLVGDRRRARQQPQVLTIRITHQGHTVIVIQVQHPVIATGQVGEQATEPVIEAHPQFIGLPRLLSKGLAAGLLPLALQGLAAITRLPAMTCPPVQCLPVGHLD